MNQRRQYPWYIYLLVKKLKQHMCNGLNPVFNVVWLKPTCSILFLSFKYFSWLISHVWWLDLICPSFKFNHHRLVVWNMNFMFPYIGNNYPNWTFIFFRGVGQPPSRPCFCRFQFHPARPEGLRDSPRTLQRQGRQVPPSLPRELQAIGRWITYWMWPIEIVWLVVWNMFNFP